MKYACALSSGTAGLHLSLLGLGIKEGDEVIVPSKTFISTANAAIYCNARPVFCDVDEETYQLDPSKLHKLITKKTKVIIPVHLGGNACAIKEILEIAGRHNIKVVEDAAHAHGSTYYGQKVGSFGSLGVFSFYPDKIMASSDGGIIVTNSQKLYEKIMVLRNVGRKYIGKYDFVTIGYNYRMNEIQAILAIEQLQLLPRMIKKRREIASLYNDAFENLKNLKIQRIHSYVKCAYYAYIMRLISGNLGKFRKKLAERGIETSPMFYTLYKSRAYVSLFGKNIGLCPISELYPADLFCL